MYSKKEQKDQVFEEACWSQVRLGQDGCNEGEYSQKGK